MPDPDNRVATALTARASEQDELSLRIRQQALATEFANFGLQTDELRPVLDEACRIAAQGMACRFAKAMAYLPGENAFLICAGVGWRPGVVGHEKLGDGAASPAGHAFRTGEPVLSNHLATETRFRTPALLIEHGVHSAANVLIRTSGPPYGILEADSTDRDAFTAADTAFLENLAATLANAIAKQQRIEAKDLLLLEVHHRVKNSLQLVQNLLLLQGRSTDDEHAREQLLESAARVRTIGAIHDRLYRTGSELTVEIGPYLEGLVEDLRTGMASTVGERPIRVSVEPATWPAASVPTLGLVLTELVTNALKYGTGTVDVSFSQPPAGNAVLRVCDEGRGPPEDFDPARSRGVGMRLVTGLLRGEGAGLEIDRGRGQTCFIARLPPERPHAR